MKPDTVDKPTYLLDRISELSYLHEKTFIAITYLAVVAVPLSILYLLVLILIALTKAVF